MPSQRRIKVFVLLVLLFVLTTIYFNSAAQQTEQSDFYQRTTTALQRKKEAAEAEAKATQDAEDSRVTPDVDVSKRLKEAEEKAKKAADEKGRKMAQEVMGEGIPSGPTSTGSLPDSDVKSVAGRVVIKEDADERLGVAKVGGNIGDRERNGDADDAESEEEHEVEVELNAILKRSPIVIFSKSYCPYSRKAKRILLETYNITPAPYVVELDMHPLGPALQALLGKKTKRTTVPNILINGLSIGGGDDIEEMHNNGKIEATVQRMGGKRILEVKRVEEPEDPEKVEVKRDTRRRRRVKI